MQKGDVKQAVKPDYEQISEKLKALGHPARLQIIVGIMENECNVSQIQEALGLPQSTISQHLKTLKSSGIIRGRKEGTKICYRVIDTTVRQIMEILKKG